jgi:hypothetical protein
MMLSLRAACIGGLVALSSILGCGSGFAQTAAAGQTAPPPVAAAPVAAAPGPAPLSIADAAAAKADPHCQASDVSCSWNHCYPLSDKWHSYSACIADACHVKVQDCVMELIQDLYDPDREANKGTR